MNYVCNDLAKVLTLKNKRYENHLPYTPIHFYYFLLKQ